MKKIISVFLLFTFMLTLYTGTLDVSAQEAKATTYFVEKTINGGDIVSPQSALCPACKKGIMLVSYTWGGWVNKKEVKCKHHNYGTDIQQTRKGTKTTTCNSCNRGTSTTVYDSRTVCHGYDQ